MAATAVRFFKIILRKAIEDGNLKIPNSFTRKHGAGLENPVYLNPPDGTQWTVHWTKHDEAILFEKGWKEFAAYYSLDHGHLMVFEYKETCHFEVLIFGMSGLEIDHPDVTVERGQKRRLKSPLVERGQKRRLKSPLASSPSTSKKLRTSITSPNLEGSQSGDEKLEMLASVNQHLQGKKNRRKQGSKPQSIPFPSTSKALEEANKFHSRNPYFILKLVPSHLTGSYLPHMSVFFFRKYFKQNKQNASLQFRKKLWPLRLIYYPWKGSAVISAGWIPFARANKLQGGDVCIFELVNKKDSVLEVHIFRG